MRTWIVVTCLLLLVARAAAESATPGPVGQPAGAWREQIHWVPMRDGNGVEHLLYTRICRPPGDAPARVVLINHGSPPNPSARPGMLPMSCDIEPVQWFLARGYMVVQGMRRGYGPTGGAWAEGYGSACSADGYADAGRSSVRDIEALVAYATALPYARPNGVVVVGHSAGAWATVAYDSRPHPKVVAMVSMAGGRGGHEHNVPHENCRPDELERAAGRYGATATTPMLWIYAANDSFFSPEIAAAMYAAFTQAGGKAELDQVAAFGSDGHMLFIRNGGSAIWGPLMARYLAERLGGS
jgi:pimeloyl-ACP methyl ester carboxylesterase